MSFLGFIREARCARPEDEGSLSNPSAPGLKVHALAGCLFCFSLAPGRPLTFGE